MSNNNIQSTNKIITYIELDVFYVLNISVTGCYNRFNSIRISSR